MLTGGAGCGKDTYYSRYKIEHSEKEVVRFAFADAIKDLMVKFFKWDRVDKEGKWRTILQQLGRYFRDIDHNVWVDYIADDIKDWIDIHKEMDCVIFVNDLRFDGEVIRIKELLPNYEVEVLRLHRDFESKLTEEQKNDISERGISDYLVDREIYS